MAIDDVKGQIYISIEQEQTAISHGASGLSRFEDGADYTRAGLESIREAIGQFASAKTCFEDAAGIYGEASSTAAEALATLIGALVGTQNIVATQPAKDAYSANQNFYNTSVETAAAFKGSVESLKAAGETYAKGVGAVWQDVLDKQVNTLDPRQNIASVAITLAEQASDSL
jgi:hypothetical protein